MNKMHVVVIIIALLFSFIGYSLVNSQMSPDSAVENNVTTQQQVVKKEKAFNAESFTLQNGMQVVLIENHRAPILSHMIWYKVGAADEDWGNSGLAHFFEHLMFKGTQMMEPGEYSKTIRALGGQDNAFTGQDFTAYFVNISNAHLETIMRMEADRMVNLNIPEEHFLSEQKVILEERAQRTDTNPTARLLETLRATLYPNHAYGVPVIGWREEIEALTHKEAMDFYKKWYAPNNAILVIAGAISREELEPLAQEIYGRIPAKEVAERLDYKAPHLPGNKHITYSHEQIKQPSYLRLCRLPSHTTEKKAALALDIASNILDGGAAQRVYQALVSDGKLASSASFSYSALSKKESTAYFSATPLENVALEKLGEAFDKVLQDYLDTPPSDEKIQQAKDRIINNAVYARDSLQAPAYIFGQSLTTGLTIDDVEYWQYDIQNTPNESIRSAVNHLLDKERCVTGHLLPPEVAEQPPLDISEPAGEGESNE